MSKWLEQQIKRATAETEKWPLWRQESIGHTETSDVEKRRIKKRRDGLRWME